MAKTHYHLDAMNAHRNQLSLAHLSTHSITSSFLEFEAMLNQCQLDIVALSETLLKDSK